MRNVIQWDLNSFFFQKLTKNRPAAGGFAPSTPVATGGWGLCPQTPVCDTFECTSLLNTSFQVRLLHTFQQLVFRPLPLPKSWQSAIRLRLQIFHSTISLPHKKLLFSKISDDVIACDLWFGPPPIQKSWLRLCSRMTPRPALFVPCLRVLMQTYLGLSYQIKKFLGATESDN